MLISLLRLSSGLNNFIVVNSVSVGVDVASTGKSSGLVNLTSFVLFANKSSSNNVSLMELIVKPNFHEKKTLFRIKFKKCTYINENPNIIKQNKKKQCAGIFLKFKTVK